MRKNALFKAVLIFSISVLTACSKVLTLSTQDIAEAYSGD